MKALNACGVIIPAWVEDALKSYGLGLNVLTDIDTLKTFLTANDVAKLIYVNRLIWSTDCVFDKTLTNLAYNIDKPSDDFGEKVRCCLTELEIAHKSGQNNFVKLVHNSMDSACILTSDSTEAVTPKNILHFFTPEYKSINDQCFAILLKPLDRTLSYVENQQKVHTRNMQTLASFFKFEDVVCTGVANVFFKSHCSIVV